MVAGQHLLQSAALLAKKKKGCKKKCMEDMVGSWEMKW